MPPLRFTGRPEDLIRILSVWKDSGEWLKLNANQIQFRHQNGGIANWYPSTGTISFQGNGEGAERMQAEAAAALRDAAPSAPQAGAVALPSAKVDATVAREPDEPPQVSEPLEARIRQLPAGLLGQQFTESELVIGIVAAVGTSTDEVVKLIEERLSATGYETEQIRISRRIIPNLVAVAASYDDEYKRISAMMDAGNDARRRTQENAVLALGVAAAIATGRAIGADGWPEHRPRRAYVITSLKHPEEVARLREVYPEGFYLIGVHEDERRRHVNLVENKRMSPPEADDLIRRDQDEQFPYGQRTSDTFHLSDFFVRIDGNSDRLRSSVWRVLDVLFARPYVTPTFDEYAMFMAFAASLRSADLSRQVGAVVARDDEIVATGANDCPKYGGGLYWPELDGDTGKVDDVPGGRDHTRGIDANKAEQQKIIDDIVARVGDGIDEAKLRSALSASRIGDITEYGRMVHAEMEALLACARVGVSPKLATLYCTTFPCHNCAKHIIAAGVDRVVYVEPYPKSKAMENHSDAINLGFGVGGEAVCFEPFVGVGPRRFFDLFSMKLGSGFPLKRKSADGQTMRWAPEDARMRTQMLPASYLELELIASSVFERLKKANAREEQH